MKKENDHEITDLYCILVETQYGEGLVFASSTDPEWKDFPHSLPLITHSKEDLDGMLEIAERIARKTEATLILYRYSARKLVKTITGEIEH